MKIFSTILVLAVISFAVPAQEVAVFTGRSESITTISGRSAWNCEYKVRGNYTFWKIFSNYCPATINVQ